MDKKRIIRKSSLMLLLLASISGHIVHAAKALENKDEKFLTLKDDDFGSFYHSSPNKNVTSSTLETIEKKIKAKFSQLEKTSEDRKLTQKEINGMVKDSIKYDGKWSKLHDKYDRDSDVEWKGWKAVQFAINNQMKIPEIGRFVGILYSIKDNEGKTISDCIRANPDRTLHNFKRQNSGKPGFGSREGGDSLG